MYILYSILLYFSLCHSDIARPNIYIFLILFIYIRFVCIVRYYCTVRDRNTSISQLHQLNVYVTNNFIWFFTKNHWTKLKWTPTQNWVREPSSLPKCLANCCFGVCWCIYLFVVGWSVVEVFVIIRTVCVPVCGALFSEAILASCAVGSRVGWVSGSLSDCPVWEWAALGTEWAIALPLVALAAEPQCEMHSSVLLTCQLNGTVVPTGRISLYCTKMMVGGRDGLRVLMIGLCSWFSLLEHTIWKPLWTIVFVKWLKWECNIGRR
jgi:hypothetical protein